MTNSIFELNDSFSTTRRISKTPPCVVNEPEDRVHTLLFLPPNPQRKAVGGLRTQGYFKQNEPNKPLISVITVVFNGEQYLEQTIRSVIEQSYDNVEYIIIDGGSTDGTLDIIKNYEDQIDYWVSEPDKGISDAFNKGISLCQGEMIGIINADDWYEPTAMSLLSSYISKYDVIYGNMALWISDNTSIEPHIDHNNLKTNMTLCHPSVFISRKSYKTHGTYNSIYRYAMDYDLLLRLYLAGESFYFIRKKITNMRELGISNKMWIPALLEVKTSKIQNGLPKFHTYLHLYFYLIKRAIRIFVQSIGFGLIVDSYRKFYFKYKTI